MMRHALFATLTLALCLAPALAEVSKEEVKVSIDNFTFNPAVLTIKAGTSVIFENGDDIPHSIVDLEGKFHSMALDTGEKFTFVFDAAGEINYACGLHPHMKGKIIVTP